MDSASQLASHLAKLIRDHFTIEGEPPPPCPESLGGFAFLVRASHLLTETLGPQPSRYSFKGLAEMQRNEAESRLRKLVETINAHFGIPAIDDPRIDTGVSYGGLSFPPVPANIVRTLDWCADKLAVAEKPAAVAEHEHRPPAGKGKGGRPTNKLLAAALVLLESTPGMTAAEAAKRANSGERDRKKQITGDDIGKNIRAAKSRMRTKLSAPKKRGKKTRG